MNDDNLKAIIALLLSLLYFILLILAIKSRIA